MVDTDNCLRWLEHTPTAAVQVIGPSGHGKSTHLRALQYAWQARHPAQPLPAFVYFPEEGDQPALPTQRPLFVDEAQRMGWLRRRQLLTRTGPLAIGTHRDMSGELTRAGFAVKVIDLDQPMPPERLRELLNRRITASRSAHDLQGKDPKYAELMFTLDQVVALQQRFGSNIRRAEAYLYDHFQCCVLKGEPWLPVK